MKKLALLVLALSSVTLAGATRIAKPRPARYVYVWAGTGTPKQTGLDMIAVIDANPASPKYGTVIDVLTVDSAGSMPHHSELELPSRGPLFVNDYGAGRSFMKKAFVITRDDRRDVWMSKVVK